MNKKILKDLVPPFLIKSISRAGLFNYGITWRGNYDTWEQAQDKSTGYDSEIILNKVKISLLKVKRGESAFERDSVVFNSMEYDWPILASLMWVAAQTGQLNVLDFGGSLGSTYFQNISFLHRLKQVSWSVIEQPHFVKCGRENFQDDRLKFYPDIASCLKENKVNVIILSSVLPYMKEPYKLLNEIALLAVPFVVVDKVPLLKDVKDRITVQHVPASIYKASYPAWFFSREKFYEFIALHYEVKADFDRDVRTNIEADFKGLLLSKKN